MYCRWCLYDLAHTRDDRCPECGGVFSRDDAKSTLPTDSRWKWLMYHLELYLAGYGDRVRRKNTMYCRECYADLTRALTDRCPSCRTWFNSSDPDTYRRSDHALRRIFDRFREVCLWRGVLMPLVALIIGLEALIALSTWIPYATRINVGILHLEDWSAAAMGIGWLGIFLMLNSHFFWNRIEPFWRYSNYGVALGGIMFVGGWFYALFTGFS